MVAHWDRTAVSTSTTNCRAGLGIWRMGTEVNGSFSTRKAVSVPGDHTHGHLTLVRVVKGATTVMSFLVKCQ